MNVLFVYSDIVIEKCAGKYYHNFLGSIINRYSTFGNLTICVDQREVNFSTQSEVDCSNVTLEYIEKENTIKKRFLYRKRNRVKIKNLVQNTDLLIAHLPNSVAEMAIGYAHKYNKKFIAVAIGCPWDALWNYNWKGKLLAPIAYWSMKKAIRHAPYAIYVTNHFLQERYPCCGKSFSCSDVSIDTPNKVKRNMRIHRINNYCLDTPMNIVTTAAVNVPFKGQRDVIKAIYILQKKGYNFHYYLIGGGDQFYLRNYINKYHLEEYVHFVGILSHEEVLKKLDEMDIYIQPSRQEGLPRALVEAMSCGLPALGTMVGGIPELLDRKYLYRKGKCKELVSLLERISKKAMLKMMEDNITISDIYTKEKLDRKRNSIFDTIVRDLKHK